MFNKKKKLIAALCCICMGTALAAAGCRDKTPDDTEPDTPPIVNPTPDIPDNPNIPDDPGEDQSPVITVDKTFATGTYIVGQEVTLPKASASDAEDGDISSKIKLRVQFKRDEEYMLFGEDEEEEVKGNSLAQFTPVKCGKYTAIYTVRDTGGNTTREEIEFNVTASGETKPTQLLADQTQWTLNDNAHFDDEGNVVFSDTLDSSLSYNQKIKSGDAVQFRLNGLESTTRYITLGGVCSKSYLLEAPDKNESTFPGAYLTFCIFGNTVEIWLCRTGGVEQCLSRVNATLLDGKDHTFGFRHTLIEDDTQEGLYGNAVKIEVWIDSDITARPFYESTTKYDDLLSQVIDSKVDSDVTKAVAEAMKTEENVAALATLLEEKKAAYETENGSAAEGEALTALENAAKAELEATVSAAVVEAQKAEIVAARTAEFDELFARMFNPETFGGYFNIGAARGKGDLSIKAFAINGEQKVGAPTLKVTFDDEEKYYMNREITFPKATTAEDGNDYSDLSSRVTVKVIKLAIGDSEDETIDLEGGYTFTPTAAGYYRAVYTVVDYSGNKAFVYRDFTVAVSENSTPPVIVLSSKEAITAKIGEEVTLPELVSAIDGDGLDCKEYGVVTIEGCEACTLKTMSHTFWTEGEHTVKYTVKDLQGNVVTEEVKVTVTAEGGKGLLSLDADSFGANIERKHSAANGDVVESIVLKGGYSAGYKGQKIYGEKVSFLLDVPFATKFGAGDGLDFIQFGLRADKNGDITPDNGNWGKFEWLSGLFIEVNPTDGLCICGGTRDNRLKQYAFKDGLKQAFEGPTVLSYQVTDIYSDTGRFQGISIMIWVNGEPLKLGATTDAFEIASRKTEDYMLKSGWLSMYVYQGSYTGEGYIKAVTIDGSDPVALTTTLGEDIVKEIGGGETYTVPAITVKNGDTAVESYTVYLEQLSTGALTKVNVGDELTISEEYFQGFKLRYYSGDYELARFSVAVSVQAEGCVFAEDNFNLTAEVGKSFVIPVVKSYMLNGERVEDVSTVVVKAVYDGTPVRQPITVTMGEGFTPEEEKSFTLQYYVGTTLLDELVVVVENKSYTDLPAQIAASAWEAKAKDEPTQPDENGVFTFKNTWRNYFLLKNQKLYDEKVTMTVDVPMANGWSNGEGVSMFAINLRGNKDNQLNWPYLELGESYKSNAGLYLGFKSDEGIVLYYSGEGGTRTVLHKVAKSGDSWWGETLPAGAELSWQVTDEYDADGSATGVRVKVWIKAATATEATAVINVVVEASADRPKLYDGYYLNIEIFGTDSNTDESKISGIKVERTAPSRVKNYEFTLNATYPVFALVGAEYTLPSVTVKKSGETLGADEYEIYVVDAEGTETKLTGALTVTDALKGGFKLVYKCDGHVLFTTSDLYVVSDMQKVEDGDADAVIGKAFAVAEYTAKLGGTALEGGSATLTNKDFVITLVPTGGGAPISYTAGMELPEACANGFKVVYTYGVELASYTVNPAVVVETEAEKSVTANAGATYTAPTLTASVGGEDVTDGVSIRIAYGDDETEDYTEAFEIAEKYAGGFKVQYVYENNVVYEIAVEVVTVTTEATDKSVIGWEYTAPALAATANGTAIDADDIRVTYVYGEDDEEEEVAYTAPFEVTGALEEGYTLKYTYKGLLIHSIVVTPEAITVTTKETDSVDAKAETYTAPVLNATLGETAIDADDITVYIVIGTADRVEVTGNITITEEHDAGFKLVYVYREHDIHTVTVSISGKPTFSPITENKSVILSDTYTVSELEVTVDGEEVASTDIHKYIVTAETLPEDWEAETEAEESFTVGEELKGGFKVVYVYDGAAIYTHEVRVIEYNVEFASSVEELKATKGYNFGLIGYTVRDGDEQITDNLSLVLIVGDDETVLTENTLEILDSYGDEITIELRIAGNKGDITLASYTVDCVNDTKETHVIYWSNAELSVRVNTEFTVPQIERYRLNGTVYNVEEETFTVELVYEGAARKAIALTNGKYTPVENKSFVLNYYLEDTLVDTVSVTMEGATGNIENLLAVATEGEYVYKLREAGTGDDTTNGTITDGKVSLNAANRNSFLYKTEHLYDEKVTVNLDAHLSRWGGASGDFGGAALLAFNLRGALVHEGAPQNWPYMHLGQAKAAGIYLTVSTNNTGAQKCGIQLLYADSKGNATWELNAASVLDWWDCDNGQGGAYCNYQGHWEDKYLPNGSDLSWQVTDIIEDGVATGVRVKVWIKTPTDTEEKLIMNTVVSATKDDGSAREGLFDSYFFTVESSAINWDNSSNNHPTKGPSVLNSIKIERTVAEEQD